MKILLLAGAVLCALFSSNAEARQRPTQCVETGTVMAPICGMGLPTVAKQSVRLARHHNDGVLRFASSFEAEKIKTGAEIVSHPVGCPQSAFCGCGAAVRVFGSPVRSLWLAANWFHFPRSAPAPGMVAVRSHHVFVLEADLGGGNWKVYDANSGGHQTRVHARSIAGYTIVDPHGRA